MLVGCVVVSLSLCVKLSSSASLRGGLRCRLACQAVGARRNLLLQGYRLQIVFSSELGSVDAANLSFVAMLLPNMNYFRGPLESSTLADKKVIIPNCGVARSCR